MLIFFIQTFSLNTWSNLNLNLHSHCFPFKCTLKMTSFHWFVLANFGLEINSWYNKNNIDWKVVFYKKKKCSFNTCTLTNRMEKKLDGNCTGMLRAILNKSWRQHPIKQKLYGHLPPLSKTIQIRQTRHVRHCLRSKDELINDVLLWTPSNSVERPSRTYLQQLCTDTGCSLEDLQGK